MDDGDVRRWLEALTVLSLDRFVRRIDTMGLPEQIVDRPTPVLSHARRVLRTDLLLLDPVEAGHAIDRMFVGLVTDYGRDVVNDLRAWCSTYVVDAEQVSLLFAWEQLLRRLCGLVTDELEASEASIDLDEMDALCTCVRSRLRPAARRPQVSGPPDEHEANLWEQELDRRARTGSGTGPGKTLSAIDMAASTVSAIQRRVEVRNALDCLPANLSEAGLSRVLDWAYTQAETLGIPRPLLKRSRTLLRQRR